jgi:hypothetical protein
MQSFQIGKQLRSDAEMSMKQPMELPTIHFSSGYSPLYRSPQRKTLCATEICSLSRTGFVPTNRAISHRSSRHPLWLGCRVDITR